jgi:hypothetical protein
MMDVVGAREAHRPEREGVMRSTKQRRNAKERRDAMQALDLTASRIRPAAVLNISKRFRIVAVALEPLLADYHAEQREKEHKR